VADSVSFFVPGKLESVTNGRLSRAHWTTKSQWANGWKARTVLALRCFWRDEFPPASVPKRVTFAAYVGAPWDDDNLPAAIKPVRDQLVHSGLLSGDAPRDGHTFVYRQTVCRGLGAKRGVEVSIAPASPGPGGS